MNNQWKMAPLETTAEMNEAGCQAYMEADGSTWVMHPSSMEHAYNAMLASAPVPPAGDVGCAICLSLGDQCLTCEESEFKAWAEKHFASPDYSQTSAGVYIKDWMRHSFAAWQARSREITRLTAERDTAIKAATLGAENLNKALETADGLRAELESYKQGFWGRMAARNEIALRKSEAELAKAREFLGGMLFAFDDGVGRDWSAPLLDEARKFCPAVEFQSTPAAKPVRQYYYRVDACKAHYAKDADCICWHDEGTGPLGDEDFNLRFCIDAKSVIKSWRAKPAHNADESCGQDAEAAKGGRCEGSTVESCDEKGCGFFGSGNGAEAAKGGA